MVAGLWANTNLDDGKQTRRNALQEIENTFQDQLNVIYSGKKEPDIDYNNPFFAAMKVPELPGEEEASPVHTTTTDDDIDQPTVEGI